MLSLVSVKNYFVLSVLVFGCCFSNLSLGVESVSNPLCQMHLLGAKHKLLGVARRIDPRVRRSESALPNTQVVMDAISVHSGSGAWPSVFSPESKTLLRIHGVRGDQFILSFDDIGYKFSLGILGLFHALALGTLDSSSMIWIGYPIDPRTAPPQETLSRLSKVLQAIKTKYSPEKIGEIKQALSHNLANGSQDVLCFLDNDIEPSSSMEADCQPGSLGSVQYLNGPEHRGGFNLVVNMVDGASYTEAYGVYSIPLLYKMSPAVAAGLETVVGDLEKRNSFLQGVLLTIALDLSSRAKSKL